MNIRSFFFKDLKSNELPEREFLISVISIINLETTKSIITEAREIRSIIQSEDEGNLIRVTPDFKELFRICSLHKSSLKVFILI